MNDAAAGLPARIAALSALTQVLRKRRPLDQALTEALQGTHLSPRDTGFAHALAHETLRRFGQLDAVLRHFMPKAPPRHRAGPALEILMLGACELLFLDIAPHAAVDAANRLAARDDKAVHFKSLINAVLRNVAREGANIVTSQDAARLNTPDWLRERWVSVYGEETARSIAEAHALPPPLDIMLKPERAAPANGVELGGHAVRLPNAGRIEDLAGYAAGDWWVQDFAATLPARLLGEVRGKRVIDLCAAPGGKAMQLAAAGSHVTAVEREPGRIERMRENFARTKLAAELVQADLRDWRPADPAPLVLLDAPCSATGTIRRHPELPWIKSAADINLCAAAAGELLDAAAEMVVQGGLLVFAVCSLEPEEGIEQVEEFLRRNSAFHREAIEPHDVFGHDEWISAEGDLRTLPCHLNDRGGMDGFYAARLRRL